MRGRARPPRGLGRLQAGRDEAPAGRRRAGGQPDRDVGAGRSSRSSCPTGWSSSSGAPALRRAHLDQVVAALWPGARRHAPRLQRRARAAQRAAWRRSAPAAPSRASLPAWDAELARHGVALMADRDATRRPAAPALCTARTGPRPRGRGRAALPAAVEGRRRRGAGGRAGRAGGLRPRARLHRPRAAPRRPRASGARAASCGRTARAASSGSGCSRCCWPSARSSPTRTGPLRCCCSTT